MFNKIMGNTITPNNNISTRKYTDSEIKENIKQLFLRNRDNMVETSFH
jgi:hypothetical protein